MISMIALMLMVTGCRKDEEYARPAVYGRIICTPTYPSAGQKVKLTVQVKDAGHRIFHADYKWKGGGISDEVSVTAPDGSKTITDPPTYEYVFMKSGTYTISMSASFKYSMTTEGGTLFGGASAESTTIRIR